MTHRPPDPLAQLYAGWVATTTAHPEMTLDQIRALFEHWGDVTAEPGGIDYVEDVIGGVEALWALPKQRDDAAVLLCFHGGGYVLGSMYSHRKLYGHFAKAVGCRALILNYRRAPEHVHPGPVEDAVAAYAALLRQPVDPAKIAFVGDSAGGALAIAAMLKARDDGLPLPAAAVPLAPYLDMEAKGATYQSNDAVDALGSRDATLQFVDLFLGPGGDRHDPLANPLHADLKGLPPMLIQTGGDDVLLDDSRGFAARAGAAGVDVTLEIAPGMQHVFHFLAGACAEADAAVARAGQWLRARLAS